ncbi:MAG: ROK family protein [Bacteroidales bacterium]|nr:ROK family protein [Bacteroidales bacterium]
MALIGIDLGATKISAAIFNDDGDILQRHYSLLEGRSGEDAGTLVCQVIKSLAEEYDISGAGICVPGIVYSKRGTVWCPNIPGWDDYPLGLRLKESLGDVKIGIESDRTCYILGEKWKGAAKDCDNAIYLAVGSGIGAGILLDGRVIHGADDVVGATGWMALESDYDSDWYQCGCFETFASGNGIGYQASKLYGRQVTSHDVFKRYGEGDEIAVKVIRKAVQMWGKGAANLVSLFNPEIIIFGGGVFSGTARELIPDIYREALKWAQPITIKKTRFCASEVGSDAALLGAAYLAGNL